VRTRRSGPLGMVQIIGTVMTWSLFGISVRQPPVAIASATLSARFVTAPIKSAGTRGPTDAFHCAPTRNARFAAHLCEQTDTEWQLPFARDAVPLKRPIPLRRRIMEGMFVATSLVLLWFIILAIDGRAGMQVAAAVKTGMASNGGVASQFTNTASHVTRSAWELSYVYGPLMTFGAVAAVLVVVMTRTR
jgi:hypothetical protein